MNDRKRIQKIRSFLVILSVLMVLLVTPASVMAQSDDNNDQVVLGGRFRLRSGETIDGNLIVLGGTAILEEDSSVKGDVIITGGSLEASGTIDGNVTALGGSVKLLDNAVVNGNLVLTSASFSRSPDAVIKGDINNNVIGIDGLNLEDLPSIALPQADFTSPYRVWIDFLTGVLWAVLRILAVSGMAALIVLIAQKPTERVAQSISEQPLVASAFGLLTAIVAPALVVLLSITIILIPVALVGILLLAFAGLFGWVAVGCEVGHRIEKALKQNWAPAITAGIGTFVLSVTTSVFGIVPCVGWIVTVLASIIGIGGVLISRFGTQVYSRTDGQMSGDTEVIKPAAQDAGMPKNDQTGQDLAE